MRDEGCVKATIKGLIATIAKSSAKHKAIGETLRRSKILLLKLWGEVKRLYFLYEKQNNYIYTNMAL
jgi:hypothetical protein